MPSSLSQLTQAVQAKSKTASIPIILLDNNHYAAWLKKQSPLVRQWLTVNRFRAEAASHCLVPNKDGSLAMVVAGTAEILDIWSIAHLPALLPPGAYHLENTPDAAIASSLALGWTLACYQFNRYRKKTAKEFPVLIAPHTCDLAYVHSMAQAIGWARSLINTPPNDMHPAALAQEAAKWGRAAKAKVSIIKGDALLAANYPMIHTVGRAASVPPHMVDIRFNRANAPKVTLIGKGVCFDSGGLDIKSSSNMRLMKKDMGGAAAVLALGKAIIDAQIPVQLRILLPIVENAISGHAMRPSDIAPTRKGIHVEIGNTDAEGRLILCDALTDADEEKPDLLIDCATLTGAARVALGADIPVFFTPDESLAEALARHAHSQHDPLWRLPLWKPYRSQLDSKIADISNDPDSGYGGAITAALYLQEFVVNTGAWVHIDMMAWNLNARPGRPQGGEAMAVRALFALIKERYGAHER